MAVSMPLITPLFTPLAEVRSAVARPALASALVMLSNGPLFAGEGILMGVGAFGYLAALTSVGVSVMVAGIMLSVRMNGGVASVWFALLGFHLVQVVGTMYHHLRLGPLARTGKGGATETEGAAAPFVTGWSAHQCLALERCAPSRRTRSRRIPRPKATTLSPAS